MYSITNTSHILLSHTHYTLHTLLPHTLHIYTYIYIYTIYSTHIRAHIYYTLLHIQTYTYAHTHAYTYIHTQYALHTTHIYYTLLHIPHTHTTRTAHTCTHYLPTRTHTIHPHKLTHIYIHPPPPYPHIKEKGDWSLHSVFGFLSNLYGGIVPYCASLLIQIAGDGLASRLLLLLTPKPTEDDLVPGLVVTGALYAGVRMLAYPFMTMQVCLQTGKYNGLKSCVAGIYRERGITGFWDGALMELATMPCDLVRLLCYRVLMQSSKKQSR